MLRTHVKTVMACLAIALTGCQTVPGDYAASLSQQDPKWQTEECQQIQAEAAGYDDTESNVAPMSTSLLLGPYGVGIALAGMEHREEQRKQLARDVHLRCSSLPVPSSLAPKPSSSS